MEKWKKIQGGTLKISGLTIKKGDVVELPEKKLRGYIKQFKLIEGTVKEQPKEKKKEPVKPVKSSFKVVHLGRGWYNVETEDNKVMNENKLRADEAQKLADELNA